MSETTITAAVPAADAKPEGPSFGNYVNQYFARVRGGEMGALPAVLGLVVLVVIFSVMRPRFLTAVNFANLFQQGAAVTVIAMGLVFVLLLGEIDLSAGYASGVCAAVLAVLVTNRGYPWYVSVLAAIVTGVVIGFVIGLLVAKVGIPSFVVTLAAFLAFQGVNLVIIDNGKNISVTDKTIQQIDFNGYLDPVVGWVVAVLCVVVYAAVQLLRRNRRTGKGLHADPVTVIALRVGALAVVLFVGTYVLNLERSNNPAFHSQKGIPLIVPIIGALLVIWTFILGRTAYGRHIYAVGGNREAARRAGIGVDKIRISVFVICSGMAAIGGIIAASRANSVDPNTGGSNVLLYAVGAAVIGGTSLFGGKGKVRDAVLGGAVVAVIGNGMGLLGLSSGTQFIVTGLILLAAAVVDALSRRRAAAAGLR
jgi:D-xylose transport system permease protein